MTKLPIAMAGLIFLCACLAGCGRDEKGGAPQAQESAKAKSAAMTKEAAQTAQTYKNMDNPALLRKLAEQSKAKREPFNSLAYRELQGRTDVNTDALAALVNETKNADALLPLLLLRKLNEGAYLNIPSAERAAVLTDALRNAKTFNAWGLPHLYLEDASKAMLETGESAGPALRRMLSDCRPAPVFGGQEVIESKRYQYRLCDYALFFLERLQGHGDFRMPMAPADRDALIAQLLK